MLQVRVRKMNKTEPLLKGRKVENDVKTGGFPAHWEERGRNLFTVPRGVRPKDGISLTQASVWNVGTCRSDAGQSPNDSRFVGKSDVRRSIRAGHKGNPQVAQTTRAKVPKRGTGTERSVVAMKLTKVSGAKGSCHCRPISGSTVNSGGI
jgi:hypothetical protein